jgi:hypothetical protein
MSAPRETLQQCRAAAAAQEFHRIKKFVAACRRQWPGAMIVLWPDSTPKGANAPPNPNLVSADPLYGLSVRMSDLCQCGSRGGVIGEGKGQHHASLFCSQCERHRG